MTRTVVSFEAPEGSFPRSRTEVDSPPGRQIAELLSDALGRNGLEHSAPQEREGWAWDIRGSSGHASVECIVGLVDDAPIQWLIVTTVSARRPLRRGRRAESAAAADSLRDAWVRSIVEVLGGPHGAINVRWYDQQDFDRDHGETWAADPFE